MEDTERLRREITELLALRDRAVAIAHANIEKRLDAMNEFRAALGDQSRTYVSRTEIDLRMGALGDRIAAMEKNQNRFLGGALLLSLLVPLLIRVLFK